MVIRIYNYTISIRITMDFVLHSDRKQGRQNQNWISVHIYPLTNILS